MKFANKRPDSPKGQVYEAFKAKGVEAARKLGEKLSIVPSRVNRWLKDNGAGFQQIASAQREPEAHTKVKEHIKKIRESRKAKKATTKPAPKPKKVKKEVPKPSPEQAGAAAA